jgi:hypothetical protein
VKFEPDSLKLYDCNQYESCGSCLNTVHKQCTWCYTDNMCAQSSQQCKNLQNEFKELEKCPTIISHSKLSSDQKLFISHPGEDKPIPIYFLTKNFDESINLNKGKVAVSNDPPLPWRPKGKRYH